MYLRFMSPMMTGRRGLHMGLFQALVHCRDDVDIPAWLHRQLNIEFDWFKTHLRSPDDYHFARLYSRGYHPEAVCWFKSSAKPMIDRAWAIKALVEECGLPLYIDKTCQPGWIKYEDRYQIVAHPYRRNMPRFK